MHTTLTIGQVASQAGVGADTVRYYERRGLIPRAPRRPSGYREFPGETVRRIRFIKRAQGLGFTLEEIGQLLQLRDSGSAGCEDVMHIAEQKTELIDAKILDLQAMHHALQHLVDACQSGKRVVDCPIIESLERDGEAVDTHNEM